MDDDTITGLAIFGGLLGGVVVAALIALPTKPRQITPNLVITSPYGKDRASGKHKGVDIRAPKRTPIKAPFDGIVGHWQSDRAGYALTLLTPDGLSIRFMHLSAYSTPNDELVNAGDLLGLSGNSGVTYLGKPLAPHIHLEVLKNGKHLDPVKAFPSWPWELA